MELNWLIIIVVAIIIVAMLIIFILRNQKDKKDLVKTLNVNDEVPIEGQHDTEVNPSDDAM